MQVITKEMAISEVNSWLDFKKIRRSVRDAQSEAIDGIVECIEDGIYIIDPDTKNITFKLLFPIESISELVFKPRIKTSEFSKYSKKVKSGDTQGYINAKIACLTGQNTTIIDNMDHEDARIANYVAIFFV